MTMTWTLVFSPKSAELWRACSSTGFSESVGTEETLNLEEISELPPMLGREHRPVNPPGFHQASMTGVTGYCDKDL